MTREDWRTHNSATTLQCVKNHLRVTLSVTTVTSPDNTEVPLITCAAWNCAWALRPQPYLLSSTICGAITLTSWCNPSPRWRKGWLASQTTRRSLSLFSVDRLRFIDSAQFLLASLDKLVAANKPEAFKLTVRAQQWKTRASAVQRRVPIRVHGLLGALCRAQTAPQGSLLQQPFRPAHLWGWLCPCAKDVGDFRVLQPGALPRLLQPHKRAPPSRCHRDLPEDQQATVRTRSRTLLHQPRLQLGFPAQKDWCGAQATNWLRPAPLHREGNARGGVSPWSQSVMPGIIMLEWRAMYPPRSPTATSSTCMPTTFMVRQWASCSQWATFDGWKTVTDLQRASEITQQTALRGSSWKKIWDNRKSYTRRTMHIRWHRSAWWFKKSECQSISTTSLALG